MREVAGYIILFVFIIVFVVLSYFSTSCLLYTSIGGVQYFKVMSVKVHEGDDLTNADRGSKAVSYTHLNWVHWLICEKELFKMIFEVAWQLMERRGCKER